MCVCVCVCVCVCECVCVRCKTHSPKSFILQPENSFVVVAEVIINYSVTLHSNYTRALIFQNICTGTDFPEFFREYLSVSRQAELPAGLGRKSVKYTMIF